jgi:hypothetical protein
LFGTVTEALIKVRNSSENANAWSMRNQKKNDHQENANAWSMRNQKQ